MAPGVSPASGVPGAPEKVNATVAPAAHGAVEKRPRGLESLEPLGPMKLQMFLIHQEAWLPRSRRLPGAPLTF